MSENSSIAGKKLKELLAHIETKQSLTEYLAEYTMKQLKDEVRLAISYSKETITNMNDFCDDLVRHDHEEADTLMILHAYDVACKNIFRECVVVSPDTDVFLLLLHFYEKMPNAIIFRTGKKEKLREISIQKCFEAIGTKHASAILGFHTLTGCDQIGRFAGKSKTTWWNIFQNADDDMLTALANLGNQEALPDLTTLEHIERFVASAYTDKRLCKSISSLPVLRWNLFSKFQWEAGQLPPTSSALKCKVFRSHFCCIVLKRSLQGTQNLPSPEGYGWEINDGTLEQIMTDNLPAPIALIELSVCSCKTGCTTKRCKCLKHKLICTDMCKCQNCENDNNFYDENYDDFEYFENDSEVED